MKSIQIKECGTGAEIYIDGAKINGVTYVKIEKDAGKHTEVEIKALISSEAQIVT